MWLKRLGAFVGKFEASGLWFKSCPGATASPTERLAWSTPISRNGRLALVGRLGESGAPADGE